MTKWPTIRLGECCAVVSGGTPKTGIAEYWGDEICWATPADLGKLDGKLIGDTPRKLSSDGLRSCSAAVLPVGSVLLSSRAPIGHVAINTVPMATNQGFKSLVPHRDQVNPDYLYYWLRMHRSYLDTLGVGATFKEISKAVVSRIEIPLPPIELQKQVAETLDQADALLAKRRRSIALLDDLARSFFLEMFGETADGYQEFMVEDLAADRRNSIRTGPFGSQLLHSEFVESGISVLGIDNAVNNEFRWAKRRFVTEGKYRKLSRYQVFPGDIIITIMGTCGRCAVVPEDIGVAINTKHLCCISLDRSKCLPEFLHSYFLMHPSARSYLQRTAKGAIMSGLNMNIIKAMPVALPPLAQQERYVAVAREVQDQKLRQLRHLEELEELFDSLQAKAFHGEL